MRDQMPDHELPAELPEHFVGSRRLVVHYSFGRDVGGAIRRWHDCAGRPWPIQDQYDTRNP